MRRALKLLASLRLTVVLLTLAMLLIFVGTIAQTRLGVYGKRLIRIAVLGSPLWIFRSLFLELEVLS